MNTNKDTTKNKAEMNKGTLNMGMSMETSMMKYKGIIMMMNMGIVRRSMGTMMSRYTGRDRSGSMERNKGSSMGRESRNSHAISSMGNCMSVLNSLVRHLEKPSCYDEVLIQPARLRFQQYVSLAFISIIFLIDFIYLHLFI